MLLYIFAVACQDKESIVYCNGDSNQNPVSEDADCDGFVSSEDCDDDVQSLYSILEDADCDGIDRTVDCDDEDPEQQLQFGDCDGDGVQTSSDCDDLDDTLLAIVDDIDCDGVLNTVDCDPESADVAFQIGDCDGDGVPEDADCDDNDASLLNIASDADCDGVLTERDCDDTNPLNTEEIGTSSCCSEYLVDTYYRDRDGDGPGPFDIHWDYDYDANGNLIREAMDQRWNGELHSESLYTYSSENVLLEEMHYIYSQNDVYQTVYTYNPNSLVMTIETDYGLNGYINTTRTFDYDSDGNMTLDRMEFGSTIYQEFQWMYDTSGNRIFETLFSEFNLSSLEQEYIKTWEYNGPNGEVTLHTNVGFGPNFQQYIQYEYDTTGNLIQETDGGFEYQNGTIVFTSINELVSSTYDANGNPLSIEIDHLGDGIIDEIETYTYTTSGKVLTYEYQRLVNPTQFQGDTRHTYTYDSFDNLVLMNVDDGMDGSFEEYFGYTYDEFQRLIEETWDTNPPSAYNYKDLYEYNMDGKLIREENYRGEYDELISVEETTYICVP